MGIISIVTNTAGQGNVNPRRVKIITTDSLATVTATGYLNQVHNNGYPLLNTDVVDMDYLYNPLTRSGTYGVFTVSVNGGIVKLFELVNNSDVLLPVVSGNSSIFNGTNGQIKDAGAPPILTISSNGQTVSTSIYSDPGGTFQSLIGLMTQNIPQESTNLTGIAGKVNCGNISTLSSNVSGVVGEVNCGNVTGAVVFGVQGKVVPVGTATGNVFSIFGIFDLTNTNISTGTMALLGGYMGTTATPGTYPGLFGIVVDNMTPAIAGSQIALIGAATNLLELSDNNEVTGPTYFNPAGITSGSAGDTTKCNADKTLKISVNGTDYWIPLFSSNS